MCDTIVGNTGKTEFQNPGLLSRWSDLTTFLSTPLKDKWWHRLEDCYKNRSFYNLDHLAEMLKLFDEFKDRLHDRYATAIAIFFLHSVYESRATDNAEKSAKLLREFASETTFDAENYAADLIVESSKNCTETHLTKGELGTEDLHYLIDFDMAFLGAEPEIYKTHIENIRKEYSHLNNNEYNAQRLKVLKLFLQIPNIFATKELRERYEEQARRNITMEIKQLST